MTLPNEVVFRSTPYELVFGPARFEAEIFPAIAREAEENGVVSGGSEAFVMLGVVGSLLRDLRPDGEGADAAEGPPPQAIQQYGALIWHAHRFWQAGRPAYALSESVARLILGDLPPIGTWQFEPPAPAGYLQLPRNLLWTRVDEEAAAEPVDGFHWTWLEANPTAGRAGPRLDLLLALGLRPGRAGLSVIEIGATPPAETGGHWGDIAARETGPDYGNVLPGGELQGYHGIATVAEALKLASRCFHWLATRPDTIEAIHAGTEDAGAGDSAGLASTLPFRFVHLPAGDAP